MLKVLRGICSVFCYTPYLYLITFYLFIVRSWIKIGELPSFGKPDPETLGFENLRRLIHLTFDVFIVGTTLVLIFWVVSKVTKKAIIERIHWRLFTIGIVLIILHFLLDPTYRWNLD